MDGLCDGSGWTDRLGLGCFLGDLSKFMLDEDKNEDGEMVDDVCMM